MTKQLVRFFVQLTVILLLYYVFAQYELTYLFLIIASLLVVIFIVFNRSKTLNKEIYLELACDSTKYLELLEKKHKESDNQDLYHLQQAYGKVFKGEYAEATELLSQVDISNIENKTVYTPIQKRIQAKLAYEKQDEVILKQMLNDVTEAEEVDELLRDYIKILILLLRKEWEQAINLLMDTIPVQRARVYIIELEYYLAYSYVQFEQKEDALAVLEFVVKKGYRIIYTDLCYDLYMKIKE